MTREDESSQSDPRVNPAVNLTIQGRGAQINPGNRFESTRREEDRSELPLDEALEPARPAQEVIGDAARSIINFVDPQVSPDVGFRWTVNPYRGCAHGCVYCYARPTHEWLGMSCGLDFETRIMAKHDAAALLRRELARPSWKAETIMFSGVTDCYQPLERELKLTRACLEVLAECRQPTSIVTKNRLITRDMDLLGEMARHRVVRAAVSVTTLDNALAAKLEPRASSPSERLRAIEELSAAGVPTLVMVAPVVPGLTDREVPAILKAAREAGARSAGYVLLRLPHQVKELFVDWLSRHYPDRARHVESLVRDTRQGALYNPDCGTRMVGQGAVAQQIGQVFDVFSKRLGLDAPLEPMDHGAFRRPGVPGQLGLFDGL